MTILSNSLNALGVSPHSALFLYMEIMIIKQVELKSANIKALASMDKSIRVVFDININSDNDVNMNEINNLLYKPLILEVKEDGQYN